ncbi:hypothetical protein [Streptomyces sp. PT12]|nr:hypothetical protein [Streptomyces sp. PT12]
MNRYVQVAAASFAVVASLITIPPTAGAEPAPDAGARGRPRASP